MLTHSELVALHRSLRRERVLSVYIDGTAADPALQRSWRVQLDHALTDIRTWLAGSSHEEREELEHCIHLLDEQLAVFAGNVGAPGWSAFITRHGVQHAQHVPVPVPTLAVWSNGLCVAPYMRALKELRPAVVVLADARKADLYRYRLGGCDRIETVRAQVAVQPTSHMGGSRQGFHTGTRGATGRDAAQRTLLEGRERLVASAADRVVELAGPDGWIILAGIRRVVAQLARQLTSIAPHRVLELSSLDVHASEAEIAEAARAGASTLRDAFDATRIADIVDEAGAHGLGTVGPTETRHALDQASVRELYVTHGYLEDHTADAEEAVRAALDQDAFVEEVSGQAAVDLDRFGGVAASLRFRPSTLSPREEPVLSLSRSA